MPELPEVETIRSQLEPVLVGQRILSVEVLREKSWNGLVDEVLGAEIVGVKRKAKVLMIATSHPSTASTSSQQAGSGQSKQQATSYLLVHLKMTGQLIYEAKIPYSKIQVPNKSLINSNNKQKKRDQFTNSLINQSTIRIVGGHPNSSWTAKLPDRHTRVVIGLSSGTLFFNDMRVFGWVRAVSQQTVNQIIGSMPPDIVDPECTADYFYQILRRSGRAVKLVILDSHKVGGIGNIYANDGLFLAGIDPRRAANSLTKKESSKLLECLKQVVNLGIELGGATMADGKFVNTQGFGGQYQDVFQVYEREGELVERDGQSGYVEKFKLGGRGTYWVRGLQK